MARDEDKLFLGGRQSRRDRWFGLEGEPDFAAFQRWWHRIGKHEAGGQDLASREEARAQYEAWVASGKIEAGS